MPLTIIHPCYLPFCVYSFCELFLQQLAAVSGQFHLFIVHPHELFKLGKERQGLDNSEQPVCPSLSSSLCYLHGTPISCKRNSHKFKQIREVSIPSILANTHVLPHTPRSQWTFAVDTEVALRSLCLKINQFTCNFAFGSWKVSFSVALSFTTLKVKSFNDGGHLFNVQDLILISASNSTRSMRCNTAFEMVELYSCCIQGRMYQQEMQLLTARSCLNWIVLGHALLLHDFSILFFRLKSIFTI